MKRTIKPHKRKNIKKQDIALDIMEENQSLLVNIKIDNLSNYDFPAKAKIYLEAWDNINIDHVDLGIIKDFPESNTIKNKPLPSFKVSQRSRIKFRLKITDTKDWSLLGLAERLKGREYIESLLPIETNENINTIFQIDWEDFENPILLVNHQLRESLQDIKPVLVTAVFKEILLTLLIGKDNVDEDLEEHKWIQFAKQYKPFDDLNNSEEAKKIWINSVLDEFSKN